jgi:hypothetical protein
MNRGVIKAIFKMTTQDSAMTRGLGRETWPGSVS